MCLLFPVPLFVVEVGTPLAGWMVPVFVYRAYRYNLFISLSNSTRSRGKHARLYSSKSVVIFTVLEVFMVESLA